MITNNECINCPYYDYIHDGYGLCTKEEIVVMVIADYEPTKNYLHCRKEKKNGEVTL